MFKAVESNIDIAMFVADQIGGSILPPNEVLYANYNETAVRVSEIPITSEQIKASKLDEAIIRYLLLGNLRDNSLHGFRLLWTPNETKLLLGSFPLNSAKPTIAVGVESHTAEHFNGSRISVVTQPARYTGEEEEDFDERLRRYRTKGLTPGFRALEHSLTALGRIDFIDRVLQFAIDSAQSSAAQHLAEVSLAR